MNRWLQIGLFGAAMLLAGVVIVATQTSRGPVVDAAAQCSVGDAAPIGDIPVALRPISLPPAMPKQSIPVMVQRPSSTEWIVVHQEGVVHAVDGLRPDARHRVYLDIRDRVKILTNPEAGLVGLALADGGEGARFAYVFYTGESQESASGLQVRISRFEERDGVADPDSEEILLIHEKDAEHHHAGSMVFGPDGFLYVSVGDSWPNTNAQYRKNPFSQDPHSFAGKVLRLDVSAQPGYRIPPDSPFADGVKGAPEVYAYGLRNPWKLSFDRETGALWLGDVGRHGAEEINVVTAGGNYGWPVFEGGICHGGERCDELEALPPFFDFPRQDMACVIGGFVYRGAAIPELYGRYVFGDCVHGTIWALDASGEGEPSVIAQPAVPLIGFAEDSDGELYFTSYPGDVYALERWDDAQAASTPTRLSQTGCFQVDDPRKPAGGMLSYQVNFPAWSDGVDSHRFISVPPGLSIDGYVLRGLETPERPLGFDFPVGTVFAQHFESNGVMIETRILTRHANGQWHGFSYEWLEDQSDAVLRERGGVQVLADGVQWTFPSRGECLACHTRRGYRALGFHPAQLDRDVLIDGEHVSQLEWFRRRGVITAENRRYRRIAPKDDPDTSDAEWVRGYLHSNCSMCHAPGGSSARANFDARTNVPFSKKRLLNAKPRVDDLDVRDARVVAPGDPERSILLNRVKRKDALRMPFIGNLEPDEEAMMRIEAWIRSL